MTTKLPDPIVRTTVVLDKDLMKHFKGIILQQELKLQDAFDQAVRLWCKTQGAPYEPETIGAEADGGKDSTS